MTFAISECLFKVSLLPSGNLSLSDIVKSVWPSSTTSGLRTIHRKSSQQKNDNFIECTFEFEHRISIQRLSSTDRSSTKCHLEYQLLTFDSRLERKSLKSGFNCISDDPVNFNILIKKNVSPWLKSSLRLRQHSKANETTISLENVVPAEVVEKRRRHAIPMSSLNESVCVNDVLQKVIVENLSDDVIVIRRLEMEVSDKVCTTAIEMPFGYHTAVNVSVKYSGKNFGIPLSQELRLNCLHFKVSGPCLSLTSYLTGPCS